MKDIADFGQILKSFSILCSELDKRWMTRRRILNTSAVLRLLILQIWNKKFGAKTAIAQLVNENALPVVTASAFCQTRQKIPWQYFRQIFLQISSFFPTFHPQFLWRGRRIFAVDGSRLTLPHSFQAKKYRSPSRNSYYPQALLSVLYQLKLGVAHQAKIYRHLDERRALVSHLRKLQTGDVLVLDRGFFL